MPPLSLSSRAGLSIDIPCKVNLHLGIHAGRDERGYHRADSVMAPVALFDTVRVSDAPALAVCHEPALSVAPERTTVWKAATLLAAELGEEPAVRVDVRARIPERAGLGGSSADAGATLQLLARLWGIDPLDERVVGVARRVGADVPFFLRLQTGLYLGGGDVLARVLPGMELPLALVMPAREGVSTAEAYAEFDRSGESPASYEPLCEALEVGDEDAVCARLRNNLGPAAARLCGEVGAACDWLARQPGVRAAQVTGSGACSFGICESAEAAERVAGEARARGWRAWATRTLA